MVVTAAEGSYVWDGDGNRLLDFSSQLVNTNIGHQHPKVVAAIQEQAAKLCTVAPQHANDARSEAARLIAERTARRPEQGLLHQRRRRRQRARGPDGPAAHRPLQGADALPLVPRRHRHRDQHDRRPAPLAQRLRQQRRRALLRPVPLPQRSSTPPPRRRSASARWSTSSSDPARGAEHDRRDRARVDPRHGRHHGSAARLPGRRAGAVRPLRHRVHRRRGDGGFGRTGKWFAVDHFDVVPDLLTFAKGVNSGYVPLGGVAISPRSRRRSPTGPTPAA